MFIVTIRAKQPGGRFVCPIGDATVGLGAETHWALSPTGMPDTYTVVAAGKFLSAGPKVDLASRDDGSGHQRWTFESIAGRIFRIKDGTGQYLSYANGRPVMSATPKPFEVLDVTSGPTAGVFVGGAFDATQRDLALDPAGWARVSPGAGYWMHPMGFAAAKDNGYATQLLANFGIKEFAYEMDLLGWSDGTNPVQTNTPSCWADWLRGIDSSFKCMWYAPWVAGDRIANLTDDTVTRYTQIRQRMDAAGYPDRGYLFFAPPCPESISVVDSLLSTQKSIDGHDGQTVGLIEYIVRAAGLRGIALDFPAGLWLSPEFPAVYPAGSADKCRQLARQASDVAQALKIPLVWVFNGADETIPQAMQSIRQTCQVTAWCVDNFADANRRGTPDSDANSVTGQALSVLQNLQ